MALLDLEFSMLEGRASKEVCLRVRESWIEPNIKVSWKSSVRKYAREISTAR